MIIEEGKTYTNGNKTRTVTKIVNKYNIRYVTNTGRKGTCWITTFEDWVRKGEKVNLNANKKDSKDLFVLFACNKVMLNSSMKVVGIFEEKELRKFLKNTVIVCNQEKDKDDNITEKGMKYCTNLDTLDSYSFEDINLHLYYGHIMKLEINKPFSELFNGGYSYY